MDRQYAAFISYRHAELDSAVAKTLHALIEQYRIPKEFRTDGGNRLGIVFRDEEELHTASDLSEEITHALDNAQFLIVICSENTLQSPWVPREIETFLKTHDRSRVLTILASGNPADVFPTQLTNIAQEDGSIRRIEPLALDIREARISATLKKLRRELPRLISAMLGCPYDALVMREQKRKIRRILSASAAIMAVLLMFVSLLFVKNRQIGQRNEELARQKAEVQLRESQLLTQDARDALDNGDYRTAITQAVAALPKPGEEDRPYHAPAEGLLMEALNVFSLNNPPVILNTTELTQMTDIREFAIHADGSLVVTVDVYSQVRCFRADTGGQLWSHTVSSTPDPYPQEHYNLLMGPETVFCFCQGRLEACSLQNGSALWGLNLPDCVGNYLFYHAEQNLLVLLEAPEDGLHLLILHAGTGQLLKRIPLPGLPEDSFDGVGTYRSNAFSLGGAFSPDGSLFAGAFVDSSNRLHCFAADLDKGTAEYLLHSESAQFNLNITGMRLSAEQGTLLLGAHNLVQSNSASLLQLDVQTGEVLWQTDIPGDPNSFSFVRDSSLLAVTDKHLLVGFYDQIFCIDPETGCILSRKQVDGILSCLTWVGGNNFGIALENGTCGLGWLYADGSMALSTGADYQISASVAPHRTLKLWGGGIVQRITGSLFELSVSNVACPGYAAVIPEANPTVLQIVRPVLFSPSLEPSYLKVPGKQLAPNSGFRAVAGSGKLILGPVDLTDPETFDSRGAYLILDKATQTLLSIWQSDRYIRADQLYWLPQTLSRVNCTSYGEITLTDRNGVHKQLSPTDDSYFESDNGWIFVSHMIRSDSAYQGSDNALLTVRTHLDTVTLWRNGENPRILALPTHLARQPEESAGLARFVKVGGNGYIFISCHSDGLPATGETAAVLDTATDSWLVPQGAWDVSSIHTVAFGREKPVMTAMDTAGQLHVLDLTGEIPERTFPTPVTADIVAQMDFLPEDNWLMLKTHDGLILILDAADGSVLYRDQVESSSGDTFRTYIDRENQRLYIACGIYTSRPDGICVDLSCWKRLSYLNGLLYFDEELGLLYQPAVVDSVKCLQTVRIPGTDELVELGTEMME